MKYFQVVLAVVLFTGTVFGGSLSEEQQPQDSSKCVDTITKSSNLNTAERIEGYYRLAQCQENAGSGEEAMDTYAMAVTVGEKLPGNGTAIKAKENTELLYRSLHNDSLNGVEKIYIRAQKTLEKSDN
jgi:hypothetical protein